MIAMNTKSLPMKTITVTLFSALCIALAIGVLFATTASAQQALEPLCSPYSNNPSSAPEVCQEYFDSRTDEPGNDGVVAFLGEVVSILSIIVGIASVIAVIIGGLFYITSAGDPQKLTRARNTIIYAVIGIAVAAVSQLIILFVLDRVASSDAVDDTQTISLMRYNQE